MEPGSGIAKGVSGYEFPTKAGSTRPTSSCLETRAHFPREIDMPVRYACFLIGRTERVTNAVQSVPLFEIRQDNWIDRLLLCLSIQCETQSQHTLLRRIVRASRHSRK